mgnify:CR=1 FL=1
MLFRSLIPSITPHYSSRPISAPTTAFSLKPPLPAHIQVSAGALDARRRPTPSARAFIANLAAPARNGHGTPRRPRICSLLAHPTRPHLGALSHQARAVRTIPQLALDTGSVQQGLLRLTGRETRWWTVKWEGCGPEGREVGANVRGARWVQLMRLGQARVWWEEGPK